MSPQLAMALHKRGINPAGPAPVHAHRPAAQDSRCAVQRIRPHVPHFTTPALRARREQTHTPPSLWQRLKRWIRSDV